MARILIVDDERKVRVVLKNLLEMEGHEVREAEDGAYALKAVEEDAPDLVLSDIRMPGLDGLTLLKELKARAVPSDVILMTAHASAKTAVEAMRAGAHDYLIKPFENDEVLLRIKRLLDGKSLKRENAALRQELASGPFGADRVVFRSKAMRAVLQMAEKVAASDATVLLRGESGTGKEVIAECIHTASSRAGAPFVQINCGALAENLLESELFGHEKGAFTGAIARKIGVFEAADRGTIFLDEVGETPPALQVKLLRVLESRTFSRLGSLSAIQVDVRVIAATNRDLEEAMAEGAFREDLFYRLDVFPIELPPLRARSDDVLPLAEHFLRAHGRDLSALTTDVRGRLEGYGWPGNVRELRNVMERACILAGEGPIAGAAMPDHVRPGERVAYDITIPDEGLDLKEVEKGLIRQALRKAEGNKSRAAGLLGITRRTLYSKLDKYGDLS